MLKERFITQRYKRIERKCEIRMFRLEAVVNYQDLYRMQFPYSVEDRSQ